MYFLGSMGRFNVQVLYAEAPDSDNLVFCYIGKHPIYVNIYYAHAMSKDTWQMVNIHEVSFTWLLEISYPLG